MFASMLHWNDQIYDAPHVTTATQATEKTAQLA